MVRWRHNRSLTGVSSGVIDVAMNYQEKSSEMTSDFSCPVNMIWMGWRLKIRWSIAALRCWEVPLFQASASSKEMKVRGFRFLYEFGWVFEYFVFSVKLLQKILMVMFLTNYWLSESSLSILFCVVSSLFKFNGDMLVVQQGTA